MSLRQGSHRLFLTQSFQNAAKHAGTDARRRLLEMRRFGLKGRGWVISTVPTT
jgi:hypothetical protein